jgi:hypothetical protein
MRIYKVNTEHVKFGRNFSKVNVAARTCEEAIRKAKSHFYSKQERVESVELVAEADA